MWPQTVRKDDLEISYYRGSGPGGQHRNKTDSACRIRHKPTGLVAQAEEHRQQGQNRKAAFKRLCEQLVPLMKRAHQAEQEPPVTERIRTYNEPRQTVKDHKSGKTYSYKDVLEGRGLEEILQDADKNGEK